MGRVTPAETEQEAIGNRKNAAQGGRRRREKEEDGIFFLNGQERKLAELFCAAETGARRQRDAIWRRARARCPPSGPLCAAALGKGT